MNIFEISITSACLITIFFLIMQITICYFVIKAAVKNAIIEAHEIIKNTPIQKTAQEDFEEEMKGWN